MSGPNWLFLLTLFLSLPFPDILVFLIGAKIASVLLRSLVIYRASFGISQETRASLLTFVHHNVFSLKIFCTSFVAPLTSETQKNKNMKRKASYHAMLALRQRWFQGVIRHLCLYQEESAQLIKRTWMIFIWGKRKWLNRETSRLSLI